MIGAIILQIILIFLNAVFASAEIAVISTNETKLQKMAEKGDKKATRLISLTSKPAKFLSTIQVAITLAGLLGSAFAADNFAAPLVDAILKTGISIPRGTLNSICVVLITLILAYFNLVFGELVPKRIAMKKAEGMALGMSGMLKFVSIIFAPIVWLLTVSTNGILKLCRINPDEEEEEVTEEEIMMMAEAGSEKGSIETEENQLIKNVFEFKELSVGEVCTHRKDCEMLFLKESDEEWEEHIKNTHHNFYPVCGKDTDDIVGILSTKEYFRSDDKSREKIMQVAISSPLFVAENTPANSLFYKMKKSCDYFAVVVDEYGGMSGIVTIHDLLEILVGELTGKDEEADYEINKISEDEWEIKGFAPIEKVTDALGIELSEDIMDEYETFGGYVFGLVDTFPKDGSRFDINTEKLEIHVLKVEGHCIDRMIVKLINNNEEDKDKDKDKDNK